MREPSFRNLLAFALAALLSAGAIHAQAVQTGTLLGTVKDSNGEGLPGVQIEVRSQALQGTRDTYSSVNGDYIIRGLPAGEYQVYFRLEGMTSVESSALLEVGKPARLDARMQVQAVAEAIEVVAATPGVLETTQVSHNVTAEEIDSLAIPRALDDIADLAPGLTQNTANNNQLTINGGFGYDNKWLVNGVEINDNVFGSFNNLFIEDAIAETQVLTSGISAEYGRFGGGVINVITKSGGNELEGSLRVDYQNPSWRNETPYEREAGIERQDTTNDIWQATLGGRILRDRLWFFAAGRTQDLTTSDVFDVTGLGYTTVTENDRMELKLTGNLGQSHSVTASYIDNDSLFDDTPSLGITIDPNGQQDIETVNDLFVVRYSGVLTSKLYAEAQYSEKQWLNTRGGLPGDVATSSPFISFGFNTPQGVDHYSAPYFDRSDPEERNNDQLAGSLSYFAATERFGSHDLKIGFERFTDSLVGGNSQSPTDLVFLVDYVQDATGAPVYDAQGRIVPNFFSFGDPSNFGLSAINQWLPERRSILDIQTDSVFVNDQWLFNDRWSFNIGFRWEVADSEATGDVTAVDTERFVPRLGVSYDVTGKGRWRLDATWAQYIGTNTVNNTANNSNVGNPSLVQWAYVGPGGQGLDFAPAFDLSNWVPIFARFPTRTVFTEKLEAPITDELTFSVGSSLPKGGWVKATFIDRSTEDIVEDFVAIANGITTITDPLVIDADNIVLDNTDLAIREYQAIQVTGRYNLTQDWTIAGNYTHQLKNEGNFVGEATNQPVLNSDLGDQVEFYNGRNVAYGRLPSFQRHKLRVWTNYDLDLGQAGKLGLGLLFSFDSGTPYSFVDANAPMTDVQLARDPGYANPPTSQTIFFGERGTQLFDDFYTFDVAINYEIPVWKTLAPWVKLEVRNVLDDDTLIQHNTTVRADFDGPVDELGLPLSYVLGPRFGQAESRTDYVTPREYLFSAGIRF